MSKVLRNSRSGSRLWVVTAVLGGALLVGEFQGFGSDRAVTAHAADPQTPDQRPAPSSRPKKSAGSDGLPFKRAEEPLGDGVLARVDGESITLDDEARSPSAQAAGELALTRPSDWLLRGH